MQLELKRIQQRGRHHVRPRHARPGGGDDDGRHDRGHERRQDRAARPAGGALRAAGDGVRRRASSAPRTCCPARSRARTRSASTTARSSVRPSNGRSGKVAAGVRPEKITIGAGGGANELPGTVAETAYIGVATQVVVRTAAGTVQVFAQNMDAGGRVPAPGHECRTELGAGVDVRRRPGRLGERGGGRMNPRLTRHELLRRGAAGGALLAFPSLLAACGGGGGGGERRRRAEGRPQLLELAALHRHRRSRRRSRQFTSKTRHQGQLLRGHQRQRRVLREGPGAALAGPGHRPRHLRLHRQLALPRPHSSTRGGCEKLDKNLIPNIVEPHRRAAEPAVRSQPRRTRCRGSRA